MAVAASGTFTSPISFCPASALSLPTVDSAKAIVFEVPSTMALIALHCWLANIPVVGTFENVGAV
jgi:hypothetical protein